MPESGVTKHNYLLCQFINPARGHEGERCDCYDTPSQKRTTLAKQRLICLRANRNVNRGSTSGTTESAVASNPAVTVLDGREASVAWTAWSAHCHCHCLSRCCCLSHHQTIQTPNQN